MVTGAAFSHVRSKLHLGEDLRGADVGGRQPKIHRLESRIADPQDLIEDV